MTSEENARLRKAIKLLQYEKDSAGYSQGMDILYSLLRSDRYRVPAEEVPS